MSTTSTSALSSVLSATNSGSSGIDVTSAVTSIIYADRAPERAWQAQQTTLNNQATEISQLESESSTLTTSLQALSDVTGAFSSVVASSSNAGVVTASAEAGTATGQHSVVVTDLATTGSWYSDEQTSSTSTLAEGSFSITEGGTTTGFSAGGSSGVSTLDQLAGAINTASIGVKASVVTDSSGSRLSLVAQNSGSAADFTVSGSTSLGFKQVATGTNAALTVDGVPISSATNTVTGAITGLTLNLQSKSTTPVTISLAPDTSTIQSSLNTFVSAYNTLIKDLNGQFTYNASSNSEGVLSSDSSARAMQNDVLSAANLNIGSGSITTLASLGIATNKDGTLSINTSTLESAVTNNFQSVVNFFQGSTSGSGTTVTGYASTVINTLNTYTDPSQGAFTVDLQSNSNEYNDLASQITTYEVYIANQQTLLTTEYNNANIALEGLSTKIKQVQTLLGENTSSSGS